MPSTPPITKGREVFENWVTQGADSFVVSVFRGVGVYEKRYCDSLDEAIETAKNMERDRPAMIYATRDRFQVHVQNVE